MSRRCKFKQLKPGQPPQRPLTSDEVARLLAAGKINVDRRSTLFYRLELYLDEVREEYISNQGWKWLSLTDLQLANRLSVVRESARQLRTIVADSAFRAQVRLLAKDSGREQESWPFPEVGLLDGIVCYTNVALEDLKRREAWAPNSRAVPSAKQPGLKELAIGLAWVWRTATSNEAPSAAPGSSMIPFLREGFRLVAGRNISDDAAHKWARLVVKELGANSSAVKCSAGNSVT